MQVFHISCHTFTFSHVHSLILHVLDIELARLQLAGTLSCSLCSLSSSSAGSRLQDRLKLSSHADFILFLTDHALDGRGQATWVPGEYKGVAILAAAIVLQSAAGVGDGIVVIVGVDHPVVVTLLERKGEMTWNDEIYCKRNLRVLLVQN